jgi:hypothetical protein
MKARVLRLPMPARSRLVRRFVADRSGATLVQFVAVLPIFVITMLAMYAMFAMMAARDTLCDSVSEAARYLQVEGPHFPSDDVDFDYPVGWERIAEEIVNQELVSRTMAELYPVDLVAIWPDQPRRYPEETTEIDRASIDDNLFYVRASKVVSTPLGLPYDLGSGPGQIKLTCRVGGFFEGPPAEPTFNQRNPGNRNGCDNSPPILPCRPCPGCTETPVPGNGTPTVCPDCR